MVNLAASTPVDGTGDGLKTAFDSAIAHIHSQQKYTPEMLFDKPLTALINETNRILSSSLTDNLVPEVMLQKLRNDVFVFSGCKTHLELKEVSNLLTDANGKIKPYQQFSQEVLSIHKTYNQNYLEAEHIFAVSAAESAARWNEYEADGDRYNLQYRTASDDRVRDEHAALHNTTLPVDDPFWSSYFPPNGWRCRCVAVQVRKGKFDVSNSAEAIAKGEKATTQMGKDGQNRLQIFRFNPGKMAVIFPPNHPYYKVQDGVKNTIEKVYKTVAVKPITPTKTAVNPNAFTISKEVKTIDDLNDVMKDFATAYPDLFARGFKGIQSTNKYGINGSTDRFGNIALKGSKINNVKNALNNIKNNIPTTFEQEDSLSTLWHEIHHNSSKFTHLKAPTAHQVNFMELNNEMTSRKTIPDFLTKLGGKLNNTELISNRVSTGYNARVRNFERLIRYTDADFDKVINQIKINNVELELDKHQDGLTDAIIKNTKRKYGKKELKEAIKGAVYASEDYYDTLLSNILKEK